MILLLKYWKQLTLALAIFGLLFAIHHAGFLAGEKKIQTQWDAQRLLDAQVVAQAAAKTTSIVVKSNTGTQNANDLFQQNVIRIKDFYNRGSLSSVGVRKPATGEAGGSSMSQLSGNSGQLETASADTVSLEKYQELERDCTLTTEQLDNAQMWAQDQQRIYNPEGR